MDKKFRDCFGCLKSIKTPDGAAKRKYFFYDEDIWFFDFGRPYFIDAYVKILLSKAFRRLSDKTQVMTSYLNRHIRSRSSHSFEVANIAVTGARILGLNEDLTFAIGLGHDIGHAPFGHSGELVISEMTKKDFSHEIFGVVVAQKIEREGRGLNLTHQVLSGIACSGILSQYRKPNVNQENKKIFPEAVLCVFADKIGYIWADFNDIFLRSNLEIKDYPELEKLVRWFGGNQRERVKKCAESLYLESAEKGEISFSDSEVAVNFFKVKEIMSSIYGMFGRDCKNKYPFSKIFDFLASAEKKVEPALVFALMSDSDALFLLNKEKLSKEDLSQLSVAEIIPHLRGKNIDFTNPDLDW